MAPSVLVLFGALLVAGRLSAGGGFSVEFVHRDSPGSPFRDPALTHCPRPRARRRAAEGTLCLAMVATTEQQPVSILGNLAQQDLHVGYDLDAGTLYEIRLKEKDLMNSYRKCQIYDGRKNITIEFDK
uniref:Xylanase inhibitor C-terminal domain-containing protein n=1 Tax=Oryza brachyantha TaxID=4533 RepID=J3KWY8_ORYBR